MIGFLSMTAFTYWWSIEKMKTEVVALTESMTELNKLNLQLRGIRLLELESEVLEMDQEVFETFNNVFSEMDNIWNTIAILQADLDQN